MKPPINSFSEINMPHTSAPRSHVHPPASSAHHDPSQPRRRILIADDDIGFLKAVTVRLQAEGFEILTVQDGYQAVESARKWQPQLILLDYNMPAGNGFSVQDRLSRIPELAKVPIIYITGSSHLQIDEVAHKRGAVAVIHKPFQTSHLLDVVRRALGFWVYKSDAPQPAPRAAALL